MNITFSTETPLPVRLTPEREPERDRMSPYVVGVALLCALVGLPILLNVLAAMATV